MDAMGFSVHHGGFAGSTAFDGSDLSVSAAVFRGASQRIRQAAETDLSPEVGSVVPAQPGQNLSSHPSGYADDGDESADGT